MQHQLRKAVFVLGVLSVLGTSPKAEASYGFTDALGTIGIGAGIGAVMGLSTIAFYDEPFQHISNALMGAGAGLIVGLGVAVYLMTNTPDEDEINPEEENLLPPPVKKPSDSGKQLDPNSKSLQKPSNKPGASKDKRSELRARRFLGRMNPMTSVQETAMRMGLPAGNQGGWSVSLQVLALRF